MDELKKFGTTFSFPENVKFDFDNPIGKVTQKMAAQFVEEYDDYIVSQIANTARESGISNLAVLNKKAIIEALVRATPKKPKEDGWFFCPVCGRDILMDHFRFCPDCGQAIDWED